MTEDRAGIRLQALARLVKGYVFEGVFHPNGPLEFSWADDSFRQLFDCEREEVNTRGWHSFVDGRDLVGAQRRLGQVAMGISVSMEMRIVSAKGRARWLRMAAEPVRDAQHGRVLGLIGMAEDITERKRLTERMLNSVNREQQRIGSDLHDELGQVLTGASLLLGGSLNMARRGTVVPIGDLEEILAVIENAIETTRDLAHGLAPGALGRADLGTALAHLVSRVRRWSGMNIEFTSTIARPALLTPEVTDHLYRIVQEAMTNVTRHAKAENLTISLYTDERLLQVAIQDDGIGIRQKQELGFGLRTMHYRANAIGADLQVGCAMPHGTKIRIVLPARLF